MTIVEPQQLTREFTVGGSAAPATEGDGDALKTPTTPREAADKAERILDILVEAKGGTRRDPQVKMARDIAMSLFGDRPIMAEGPTGTGKSLAYLAAALACGKQTVVATHSKALQDQLMSDLQMLMGVLQDHPELWDETPTFAVLKGRANYACLDKLAPRAEDESGAMLDIEDTAPQISEMGAEIVRLQEWAQSTDTGDRSDVPFAVSNRAWGMISTTADKCVGKSCRLFEECHAEIAKQQARQSTIIIANQALLAMSMRLPIFPDTVKAIIVDEAHEFDTVVAASFGAEVDESKMERLIKACGPLDNIDKKRGPRLRDETLESVRALFLKVPVPKGYDKDRAILNEAGIRQAMKKVEDKFFALHEYAKAYPVKNEKDEGIRDTLLRRLKNMVQELKVLAVGSNEKQVAYTESGWRGGVSLKSAQFDVADTIRELLLKQYRAVCFTSATLRAGGNFREPVRTMGFEGTPHSTVVVPSPFDYDTHGMVRYLDGMPLPNDPAFHATLAAKVAPFIKFTGGRAMILTTSWTGVDKIADELQRHLPRSVKVLRQEKGAGFKTLATEFLENPNSVLVATRTFWTGVSFEGDALILEVLEKMPNPSPGDPIIGARGDAVQARGGSSFGEVSLPIALRTASQGVGRLHRTVNDYGLLLVADPRLNPRDSNRKGYARDFRASIPPFRVANDDAEALEFLRPVVERAQAAQSTAAAAEIEIEEAA